MQAVCLPQVEETLRRWHELVAHKDMREIGSLLCEDAVFCSPMAHHPYQGAKAVALILSTVMEVFQDFSYERQFMSADGRNAVLEFRARVGNRDLKGVDLIAFDARGRIAHFEVMIRPHSGLQALGEEMGRRLGEALPRHRASPGEVGSV